MGPLIQIDQLVDIDELANQLTRFNINSFWEAFLATVAGAIFAFVGTLALYAVERRKGNDRRSRDALITFLKWMAEEGLPARRNIDTYIHYTEFHPWLLELEFPDGVRHINRAVEFAEVQRMALSVTGVTAQLVQVLKMAYEQDDPKSEWIAYVHWTTFSDVASGHLEGHWKTRGEALDAYRAQEKRMLDSFPNRFKIRGCCKPE